MTAHPLIKPGPDGQLTFTVSAHSLGIYDRCARAFLHYKVHKRRAVRSAAGLIAGTAIHEGAALMLAGKPVADQEAAITQVLLESPPPVDDYRTPAYLRDAMAAFRAEFAELFRGWQVEETETQGVVPLGTVDVWMGEYTEDIYVDRVHCPVQVLWEFRRDLVGVAPCGERYVCDWKSSSRDEDAQYLAYKNSGQLIGYLWSWNVQHPDKPCDGVLPVRVIMRKPSRTGVAFSFPKDPPIHFHPERVDEWRRHTLSKVAALLTRDPSDPEQWPLSYNELGGCRTQFGVCEYLASCMLRPGERMQMLMSDAYEEAKDRSKP